MLVYPGSAASVQRYASEFITGKTLPDNFHFAMDPDLTIVGLYGLRWEAAGETAYPSTIVVDRQGIVRFVKISQTHGDRSAAPDVLQVLAGLK